MEQQLAFSAYFFTGGLKPRINSDCAQLIAPGLCFLIKSTASAGSMPPEIKPRVTSNGALPSPATQCTPMRAGSDLLS